jgi:hypothetical protein
MSVNVVTPEGQAANIPDEQVTAALQQGYKLATAKDIAQETIKQSYGEGLGNELQAGVEGALSGATFGLSRHIANLTGASSPEEQAARKEYNPISSGVGEAVGTLATIPIGGEIAGVGKAATAGLLGESAASKLAGNVLGSALEGLTYGTQAPISESALGDPTLTASKAFSQIGLGGLIGGALGGTFSALGLGAKKLLSKPISEEAEAILSRDAASGGIGKATQQEAVLNSQSGASGPFVRTPGMTDEEFSSASNKFQNMSDNSSLNAVPGSMDESVGTGAYTKRDTLGNIVEDGNVSRGTSNTSSPNVYVEPTELQKKIAKDLGTEATPEDVAYFQTDPERIQNSPRLATKYDPAEVGKDNFEDVIRNAYEKVTPEIKALGEQNKEMLGQSGVSIPANDLADIAEARIAGMKKVKAPGKATIAAIKELQDKADQYRQAGGIFHSQDIKETIGELDKDLEPFYAKKIGKTTTEDERAIMGLRSDISNALKTQMTDAGFSDYEKNLSRMSDLFNVRDRVESHFSADTWYQRAIRAFEKNELNVASGAPLAKRGAKEGVSYLQDMVDLGDVAGVDLKQMYKDRAVLSRILPQDANGMEKGSAFLQLLRNTANLAKNPSQIPGKALGTIFDLSQGKTPEIIQQIKSKGAQDLLLGKSSNPQAVNSILGKFGNMGNSKLLNGPLSNLMVPAGVKLHQFIADSDSVDHADQKLEVLTSLEKAQKKADSQITSAVKNVFSDQKPSKNISKDEFLSQSPKELADSIQELRDHANELVNNPEMLMQRLDQANQGMQGAPNVVSAMNMTAVRALQFLTQTMEAKMPQGAQLPFDAKFTPSKSQLYSLAKTMKYINQPWDVLKEVASGRVSKEGKDVLENVHPELYVDMKAQVMNGISQAQAKGKSIPMAKRLAISYFLGQPLDSTMTQASIASNQMTFAMPQGTQNQPNPHAGSAKSLDISQRFMTPLQKVASRV